MSKPWDADLYKRQHEVVGLHGMEFMQSLYSFRHDRWTNYEFVGRLSSMQKAELHENMNCFAVLKVGQWNVIIVV